MPQRLPLALDDAERSFPPAADGRLYRPAASHNYLLRRASGDLFLGPTRGFQSMKTAYATIKGFEKGQFAPWIEAIGGGTEARFINRLFGIYA